MVPRFMCQLVEVGRVEDANMALNYDRLHTCIEDKPVVLLLIKTNISSFKESK